MPDFPSEATFLGEIECCALANWHGREQLRSTPKQELLISIFENTLSLGQSFRESEKDFYLRVALSELKHLKEEITGSWQCWRFFLFNRGLARHSKEEHIAAFENVCRLMTKDLPVA